VLTAALNTAAFSSAASNAPWTSQLTQPEYLLTIYFLVFAGLALFAGFLRTWATRNEVGSRYRSAVISRLSVAGVATVAYGIVIANFVLAYHPVNGGYSPGGGAILVFATRYMDWSVTVPLLTLELLAVCALVGSRARRVQFVAMASAFLMIFTGYLGAIVFGGSDVGQLVLWGAVSCVFYAITNLVLIATIRASLPHLTTEAARLLRGATVILLGGWIIYPLVYLIQIFGHGGAWATTMQIVLCCADITVKIGFGGLIHRVAKLRTAEDVRIGEDVHHESIWISSIKQSDAGTAPEVFIAPAAVAHNPRPRPPMTAAVAAPLEVSEDDLV
jgi:bacteriorhodopsin